MTTLGKDQGYSQDSNVMMEVQSGEGDKMTKVKAIFGINDPES